MSADNVDIVMGVYEAFAAGDVPAVLAAMDREIEWNEAENFPYADGSPYRGPDAVLAGVFARLAEEWESFVVQPEQFLDAGDMVVVTGRLSGAYKATGRKFDVQMAHFWTLTDGKLVRFQELTDTLAIARVVGTV